MKRLIRKVPVWLWTVILTAIIGPVAVYWLTTGLPRGGPSPATSIPNPTAVSPVANIWKTGDLTIPVRSGIGDRAADLDAGSLLPLGTSIPVSDADIVIVQAVHGIVLEPGLSKGDGVTFDARFTAINDAPVGQEGCAAAAISPQVSNQLLLSSDVNVGSYVCMVTTQGRLAEFEISKVDLSGTARQVQITFTVWVRE